MENGQVHVVTWVIAYRRQGWPLVAVIAIAAAQQLEQIVQGVCVAALTAAHIILEKSKGFPIITRYGYVHWNNRKGFKLLPSVRMFNIQNVPIIANWQLKSFLPASEWRRFQYQMWIFPIKDISNCYQNFPFHDILSSPGSLSDLAQLV